MLDVHPRLSAEDLAAVREYAGALERLRRSFGGRAEDAEWTLDRSGRPRGHFKGYERMILSKSYIEEDSQGVLRVGSLGVSLDSVAIAFQQGYSAETIQQLYPALSLEEVYGAIAYYLSNREEVDHYLERQGQLWDRARRQAAENPSPVVQRLRALHTVPGSATP